MTADSFVAMRAELDQINWLIAQLSADVPQPTTDTDAAEVVELGNKSKASSGIVTSRCVYIALPASRMRALPIARTSPRVSA